jgi:hypothetical protein
MPPLYTSLLILFLSMNNAPSSSASNNVDTLKAGQTLGAGDKLVSSNGKFALGFFQPSVISKSGINATSPNWYLGIWFNNIPILTPVWVANREEPIPAHDLKLARLKISGDGNLAIVNLTGGATESVVWSTHVANRTGGTTRAMNTTTHAVLLGTGNLVVRVGKPSSSNTTLWQSFDYPADVLLPDAKIGWNKATGQLIQYISRKNLIDPGIGSYCTALETSGTLVHKGLYNNPTDVYWSWGSVKSSTPKLIPLFNSLIDMNPQTKGLIGLEYVDNSEEEYYKYSLKNESYDLFFLQDTFGGQVKLVVWSQAQQSWETAFTHPASPCTAYATCGPFSVCNGVSYPFCECMQSFSKKSPRDWELDDTRGGCVRDNPLDYCSSNKNSTSSSTDTFHPIASVTLPYNPQILGEATTQGKCAEACLSSCSCSAYSYNSSVCSVWHGELLHVKRNDGIENTSEDVLYLRLSAKDSLSLRENKRKHISAVGIAAIVIVCGSLMIMLLLVVFWRNKLEWFGASSLHGTQGNRVMAFKYTELGHATKNFSEKLGEGGFGSVFKGVLSDLTTIAVKRINVAHDGEKQFRAEVSSLSLIQHINLVKLIGFCYEGDKRLLVYEHMINGSLDAHLFESSAAVLNWSTRYQIVVGVARGLSYLHQSCHKCIIHCDIKPQNILLDTSFVPKIADFGMAAAVGRDFSRVLTTFRGTIGYLAPEWLSGVAITPKVDVYSFGVVLLEIMSGRRNSPEASVDSSNQVELLPVQVIRKLQEGDVQSLMDPRLQGNFDLKEAERVCKVALWCIQDNELDRPTMGDVVRVLEGQQMVGMPPMPRLLAAITKSSAPAV